MRKPILAVAASLVVVCAGFAAPAVAQRGADPTTLTINFVNRPPSGDDLFRGRVMSPNPQCIEERVVRLYRVTPGPDQLLDSDRSEDNGTWSIDVESPGAASGTYYARTPARTVGANTCAADRSPNVNVP